MTSTNKLGSDYAADYAPQNVLGSVVAQRSALWPFARMDDGSTQLAVPGILYDPAMAWARMVDSARRDPQAYRDPQMAHDAFEVGGTAVTGGLGLGVAGKMTPSNALGSAGGRAAPAASTMTLDEWRTMLATARALRDHEKVGVRVTERPLPLGKPIANSRVWEDGRRTRADLNGTSALALKKDDIRGSLESVLDVIRNGSNYNGQHVSIIAGERGFHGQDKGEVVIPGARVVARAAIDPDTYIKPEWRMPRERYLAQRAAERLAKSGNGGTGDGAQAAGDGSRNSLVFDDKMIEILKKYGLVGAAGLGGAAAYNNRLAQPTQGPVY